MAAQKQNSQDLVRSSRRCHNLPHTRHQVNNVIRNIPTAATEVEVISTSTPRQGDAFSYYSNDELRMSILRLKDVPSIAAPTSEEDEMMMPSSRSSSNEAEQQSSVVCRRKTRISFEVHPSLIFEDIADELSSTELSDSSFDFESLFEGFETR